LGGCNAHKAIISCAKTDVSAKISAAASKVFGSVSQFTYEPFRGIRAWPQPNNWAWQEIARFMASHSKEAWYWWETDAVPLKAGWLDTLQAEYLKGGKPFMGHVVDKMGHMNGAAIYPANVGKFCINCFITREAAWDVILGTSIHGKVHRANHLMQHVWNLDSDFKPCMEGGVPPSFPDQHTVDFIVNPDAVVFHRCKDGSLAKRLMDKKSGKILQRIFKAGMEIFQDKAQTFKVFGGFGDMIYQLACVKAKGGGHVLIEPSNFPGGEGVRMDEARFKLIEPLISAQPYVKKCTYMTSPMLADCAFKGFIEKLQPETYEYGRSSQSYAAEIADVKLNVNEPWLEVGHAISVARTPVVVNRTARYHNHRFPWHKVVDVWRHNSMFVGTKDEYELMRQQFDWPELGFYLTSNLLELARVIAGCQMFVGNQSVAYAIAEGLKKPVIQEVFPGRPDCLFHRQGVQHGWDESFEL
jgi:hypothetical protein